MSESAGAPAGEAAGEPDSGSTGIAAVERALVGHFAQRPARASVSFVGVEPIEILRFEPIPGERAYLTLGMSRHAMTDAAQVVLSESGPRCELMLHIRDATDQYAQVWRQLAVLAAAPTVEGVVYAAGMSVDLGQPLAGGSRCTGVLVTGSPLGPLGTGAAPVDVFQVVPATAGELAWCRVRGSAALQQRWLDAEVDVLDLGRPEVDLGGAEAGPG